MDSIQFLKSVSFLKQLCLLMLFFITFSGYNLLAQNFPPPQGPTIITESKKSIPLFQLNNNLEIKIKKKLDKINANIDTALLKGESAIHADVSFSYINSPPTMSSTIFEDRPNQYLAHVRYRITYDVTNIRYHGFPYFSRRIFQNIDVFVQCPNWFVKNGDSLQIVVRGQDATLDDHSFLEQALNAFLANTLTKIADSNVETGLDGFLEITKLSELGGSFQCNCLGVDEGPKKEQQHYDDSQILYDFKKSLDFHTGGTVKINKAEVSLLSIKRLDARRFPENEPLYKEAEDIQIVLYVNQNVLSVRVDKIRVGEERSFRSLKTQFTPPVERDLIVLIANIDQLPNLILRDANFITFNKSNNFGNGIQKVVIRKSYFTKLSRLPDGTVIKPAKVRTDAYELTVRITIPKPEILTRN